MTMWVGLWNRHYNTPYTALGSNNTKELNGAQKREIARIFRGRGNRPFAKLLEALTGAAVGQTATATAKQIAAASTVGTAVSGGGVRTINTLTDISRATTAADLTLVDALFNEVTAPTYPVDRSGNGGRAPGVGNF